MTNVLFKTPVGLHEIAFIKLDSDSYKPEQDPYNCGIFFILLSPSYSVLSALVAGFISDRDSGPPGSLSAVIIGEQYVTQLRVC